MLGNILAFPSPGRSGASVGFASDQKKTECILPNNFRSSGAFQGSNERALPRLSGKSGPDGYQRPENLNYLPGEGPPNSHWLQGSYRCFLSCVPLCLCLKEVMLVGTNGVRLLPGEVIISAASPRVFPGIPAQVLAGIARATFEEAPW